MALVIAASKGLLEFSKEMFMPWMSGPLSPESPVIVSRPALLLTTLDAT